LLTNFHKIWHSVSDKCLSTSLNVGNQSVNQSISQSINLSISFFIKRHWQMQWRYIEQQCKCRKMSINISVQHADEEIISQEAGFRFRQH